MKRQISVFAAVLCLVQPLAAQGRRVLPPPVPGDIEVTDGSQPFLVAHAVGSQTYMCLPKDGEIKWVPTGPQATVFDRHGRQVLTHYSSPNPYENDTVRPAWQDSRDTSTIWGDPIAVSNDPAFVAPGAVDWLLLRVAGALPGPTGGNNLTHATFLQRVNTSGGKAPATGCAVPGDLYNRIWVPYTADYVFYR